EPGDLVMDFTLPELGENIATGDVLRVLVKPGDVLSKDQPVLELETDKATIEVPSSVIGLVKEVRVKPGDKVKVGQAILTVQEATAAASPSPAPEKTPPQSESGAQSRQSGSKDSGAGTRIDEEKPPAEAVTGAKASESTGPAARSRSGTAGAENVLDFSRAARASTESPAAPEFPPAPAAPSVRRMARELGVDINEVPGSGPTGRISIDDVKAHVSRIVAGAAPGSPAPAQALPDFSQWGEIERQP